MEILAIDDWVKRLGAIPARDFTIPHVLDFVQQNAVRTETLAPYLFYAKSHYTRNLVFKCELFEVIAICWDVGQMSRIHNHRGQNCWMATPIGRLRVQNFAVKDQDSSRHTCKLVPTDFYDMDAGHPGVVQPDQPVHQVQNLPEFGERATSLHVYSYPYSSCEIYLMDKGVYSDVPLHYSSEYGKLSPDEKLM
ncbi:MAG TPA: cysteine dioxygenase family protein [Candidatus Acidoferrum sp.]|nr:cysteine dioxygenase family protein [Candidatus Acidoferrum sp.]